MPKFYQTRKLPHRGYNPVGAAIAMDGVQNSAAGAV